MYSATRFAPRARQNFSRFGGNRFRSNNKRRVFGNHENIDISRFIKQASQTGAMPATQTISHKFEDFNLPAALMVNIKRLGYATPTPVQDQTIQQIIDGKDIIGLANTGSGKTGAYLLPIIQRILKDKRQKALVVAPTRELAIQINEDFRKFASGMRLDTAIVVGGMPARPQINDLRRNPNIIIGTPGRLKDFEQRRLINFAQFNTVVLDEVDRMLDMGFIDDIKLLMAKTPVKKQTLFFSATMPMRTRTLASQFLQSPVTVEIQSNRSADNVEQKVIRANGPAKFEELKKLLSTPECKKVLIFNETKHGTEKLSKDLRNEGFKTESIHGNKRQNQRQKALDLFRENRINVLVATDVAARGLDIKNITHVINYTVPHTFDDYIHRIGRTGRANSKGIAYTFA
jgi:ATP-dependent RNA helicase RhlE